MPKKATVFIRPIEEDLTACIRDCFSAFGGVNSFLKRKVFIKINATMPLSSAITDPDVILSTIKVIKECSPPPQEIYVFDNSCVGSFTRLAFSLNKLAKRIKKLGARPLYLDEQKSINMDFDGSVLKKQIPLPKILHENLIEGRDETTYINIPRLKTHLQTGITNCIKNQHGLLYDDEKVFDHHRIDEKLIDLLKFFKPDFNIVDATAVVDYGQFAILPEWEIPLGLLMSGTDPVACDVIGMKLLGITEANHVTLAAAHNFGCGQFSEIEILPHAAILDKYKLQLHCEGIPLRSSEKVVLIKGENYCRAGCLTLGLYFILLTHGTNFGPCVGVIGAGHDLEKLDQCSGTFIVNGPCAVNELRDYFNARIANGEKLKVIYIEDHCNLAELVSCVLKGCNIPISHFLQRLQVNVFKALYHYIPAKLHRVRCQFKF